MMGAETAVRCLHDLLPLGERQQALDPALRQVHRAILHSLAERGAPLRRAEIAVLLPDRDIADALKHLAADDLVVLDRTGGEILGAYPMTMAQTPHRLRVNGHAIHAMGALDALSVAPMFDTCVDIDSRCEVTGVPIAICQRGREILQASPSREVRVGIRWRNPGTCAANSLCTEMVFLCDPAVAARWQRAAPSVIDVFELDQTVAIGAAFFAPLVAG